MNFAKLKPSRKKPKAGDVFTMHISAKGWLFGRVISTDVIATPQWERGDPLWMLIYIYRTILPECKIPDNLSPKDLLVPPIITGDSGWYHGLFQTIDHRSLRPEDVLPKHCFYDPIFKAYFDEKHNVIPDRIDPCGEFAITPVDAIDHIVSEALGVPTPPHGAWVDDELDCAEDEVILYLSDSSDGTDDLMEIEEPLIAAVEQSGVGEYEGHGCDLERHIWDIRFNGPKPKRIADVLLPVLKTLDLPTGSFLLVGGKKRPERIDL